MTSQEAPDLFPIEVFDSSFMDEESSTKSIDSGIDGTGIDLSRRHSPMICLSLALSYKAPTSTA